MTRSPLRKAEESPRHHDYKTGVALKLAALALSLALFLPAIWLASRPSPLKDLSGGSLSRTFSTRSKELQKELLAIHAESGLPGQMAEGASAKSEKLCEALKSLLSSQLFEKMKVACDECAGKWSESLGATNSFSQSEEIPFSKFLSFLQGSPELLRPLLDAPGFFDSLDAALAPLEASSKPVSFASLALEECPSQLPDLHRVCAMRLAALLAEGRMDEAAGCLRTIFRLANASLNSNAPDFYYLSDSVDSAASALQAKGWDRESLGRLSSVISAQLARPFPQARLLMHERAKQLQSFERVRRVGIRAFNGDPPAFNMLADAIRELNPGAAMKAAEICRQDFLYSEDKDEALLLKSFRLAMKTGLFAYPDLSSLPKPQPGQPMSEKSRSLMETQVYGHSETLAKLGAMDVALKAALWEPSDPSRKNPLTGKPYERDPKLGVRYGLAGTEGGFIPIPDLKTR